MIIFEIHPLLPTLKIINMSKYKFILTGLKTYFINPSKIAAGIEQLNAARFLSIIKTIPSKNENQNAKDGLLP